MITITKGELREFLRGHMDRDPTDIEVSDFEGFVEVDMYEWLRDNYKSWRSHNSWLEIL